MSTLKLSMLSTFVHEINIAILPVLGHLKVEAPLFPHTKQIEGIRYQLLAMGGKIEEANNYSEIQSREKACQQFSEELISITRELYQIMISLSQQSAYIHFFGYIKKSADHLKKILDEGLLAK